MCSVDTTTPTLRTGHLRKHVLRRRIAALAIGALSFSVPAQAQDAAKVVKSMSDYMASHKSLSFSFDSDIEVITPDVQKIQFTSSGQVALSRPDKLHATRTGGYTDVDFTFDGSKAILLGKNVNLYTTINAPGTTDAMFDKLRDELGISLPGADLLSADVYGALMSNVIDAKHIGRGVVDGVECEHLAFRTPESDWQLWVEVGDKPLPRKYVITSKAVAGAPQYTLTTKDWKVDAVVAADTFTFKSPANAKQVDQASLPHIDEIPEAHAMGEQQ